MSLIARDTTPWLLCWRREHGCLGERQVAAVAPNVLDRTFEAPAPNRKWIADFTYGCGFGQGRSLHLANEADEPYLTCTTFHIDLDQKGQSRT
jgi:transposase InsO family protein